MSVSFSYAWRPFAEHASVIGRSGCRPRWSSRRTHTGLRPGQQPPTGLRGRQRRRGARENAAATASASPPGNSASSGSRPAHPSVIRRILLRLSFFRILGFLVLLLLRAILLRTVPTAHRTPGDRAGIGVAPRPATRRHTDRHLSGTQGSRNQQTDRGVRPAVALAAEAADRMPPERHRPPAVTTTSPLSTSARTGTRIWVSLQQ